MEFTRDNIAASTSITGVYFLFCEEKIVYVGKSLDIITRVQGHFNSGEKEFDCYNYIEVKEEDIADTEAFFIVKHKPKYNRNVPKNDRYVTMNKIITEIGELALTIGEKQYIDMLALRDKFCGEQAAKSKHN